MARTSRLAFFVSLTRARRLLHLITSLKAGGSSGPHAYLEDIPADFCIFLTHKKTGRETSNLGSKESWLRKIGTWSYSAGACR